MLGRVFFKHKYLSNPTITPSDAVIAASHDMAAALRGNVARHLGSEALQNLNKLQDIFTQAAKSKDVDQNLGTMPPTANHKQKG